MPIETQAEQKRRLAQLAHTLITPRVKDFTKVAAPAPAELQLYRIVTDARIRRQLVDAGIAIAVQSPRGREAKKTKSIVRIYPEGNAPKQPATETAPAAQPSSRRASGSRITMPTVEQMEQVIARIRHEETACRRDLRGELDQQIDKIKKQVPQLDGLALDNALAELLKGLSLRKELEGVIRQKAFAKVANDKEFPLGAYLRVLRPDIAPIKPRGWKRAATESTES